MNEPFFAEVAANLIKDGIHDLFGAHASGVDSFLKKMQLNFTKKMPAYQERRYRELANIPSLYKHGGHVNVLNNFCEIILKNGEGQFVNQDALFEMCASGYSYAVEAQAGYGKSFLLRFLFLTMCDSDIRKIPIFLELRDLNNVQYNNIYDCIAHELGFDSEVSVETIKYGLKKGLLVIFLDAFDELRIINREHFLRDLIDIRTKYPKCSIVISGRQNDYFQRWGGMSVLKIQPLSIDRVRSFISLADATPEHKKHFLDRINSEFYSKYESFLSSPLLSLLMLLTYSYSSAQVPQTYNEFYQRAYDALCIQLDSVKSTSVGRSYHRIWQSGLKYGDFSKIFSFFSAISYVNGKIRFTEGEFDLNMGEAISKSHISRQISEIDTKDVIADFFEAICLFLKEDLEYVYSHRSFQEYFAAKYFCDAPGKKLFHFLNSRRLRINDNVLPIMLEINRPKVIHDWASDAVNMLLSNEFDDVSPGEALFLAGWDQIVFGIDDDRDNFIHFEANELGRKLLILSRFFPQFFEQFDQKYRSMTRRKFVQVDRDFFASGPLLSDERFRLAANNLVKMHKDGEAFMIRKSKLMPEDIEWMRAKGLMKSCEFDHAALSKLKIMIDDERSSYDDMDNLLFD